MIQKSLHIISLVLLLTGSSVSFASTIFNQGQRSPTLCEMKDLSVACAKGDKITLDATREDNDVYLTIGTAESSGSVLLLTIDNNKPEIIKMVNSERKNLAKRVYISRSLISKLKEATSIKFEIIMNERSPIQGSLGKMHFDWLKQFGNKCS